MPNAKQFISLLMLSLFLQSTALAGTRYEFAVTRKDKNIYETAGGKVVILTKWCYEYSHQEESVLDWDGRVGYLVFLGQGSKCDVKTVTVRNEIESGKYNIRVSNEGDDWYVIDGLDLFLRTVICLELSLADEAVLDWKGFGGDLIFINSGGKCSVESVWAIAR